MATTTLAHVRMNAVGTLGDAGGNEIFSMGLKLLVTAAGGGPSITPSEADALALAEGAVTPWKTFIAGDGSLAARFSNWVNLTEIRCTVISATGIKVPGTDTQVATVPPPARGVATTSGPAAGPGTGEAPYPVAICVTLTGIVYSSGPASHGRFYLPGPNLGYVAANTTYQHLVSGQMTPTATQDWATAVGVLLVGIDDIELPSGHLSEIHNISSNTDGSPARSQRVTDVTIDNRPDTIRRRSNGIAGQGKKRVSI